MKIAFIYGNNFASKLTRFFTGSNCYHVGFTDEIDFYDMNLLFHRQKWAGLYPPHRVILVDTPVVITKEFLEEELEKFITYGWWDYVLFSLKPLYHLLGCSTRNASGEICSERVVNILIAHGWNKRFYEVPSPADLVATILGKQYLIKKI